MLRRGPSPPTNSWNNCVKTSHSSAKNCVFSGAPKLWKVRRKSFKLKGLSATSDGFFGTSFLNPEFRAQNRVFPCFHLKSSNRSQKTLKRSKLTPNHSKECIWRWISPKWTHQHWIFPKKFARNVEFLEKRSDLPNVYALFIYDYFLTCFLSTMYFHHHLLNILYTIPLFFIVFLIYTSKIVVSSRFSAIISTVFLFHLARRIPKPNEDWKPANGSRC